MELEPTELELTTRIDAMQSNIMRQIILTDRSDSSALQFLRTKGAAEIGDLHHEGFGLRTIKGDGKIVIGVIGADAAGAMYGGLELAELIRVSGFQEVKNVDQNPYMTMRGTKFNIPLDVRTPSYSDVSDAAQYNIAEMWNLNFWKNYIDHLARYRFNFISCWSLHPFPSLVKVPEYPDIALDDVHRSTVSWKEHYNLEGTGFDAPEIINNVEILKKMTIEEKIDFWRKVMHYAKTRNIDFYFITWNIFINGTYGKYGITVDIDNPVTRDYFRKSIKQMFITYPDLKGIGLTTGENMYGASFHEKEEWAFETYAQGVLDAAKEQPGREMTFIHRQHMAGALDIAERFAPLIEHPDIEFIFSFKYAKAHVYSSTVQPYHREFVKDIQGVGGLKTIWTLRNDDIYVYRWGSPDYVREFLQNIPYDVSRGYYYGSDQYIWGREFLMKDPETPRQIEIVKHWYHWMLWGRLGYDPTVSNDRFIQILGARFPDVDAKVLFTAWQEASMIYPKTTGFHWGSLDFQWYIEACQSRPGPAQTPSGFHDVNRFISLSPHPGTNYLSIPDYVAKKVSGDNFEGTTPLDIAKMIHTHADQALALLNKLNHHGKKELRHILDDIQTMACLGKYYAHKIKAATELALFRKTTDTQNRVAAIENLQKAAHYWRRYASLALGNYENPLWTNRVGHVDWRETYDYVLYDITSVGGEIDIPSMKPTSGGIILEAEAASFKAYQTSASITGYTGTGYVEINRNKGRNPLVWTFDAPKNGSYMLEFRYSNQWGRQTLMNLVVNDRKVGDLLLWNSGGPDSWVWDRILVDLNAGENRLSVVAGGRIMLDHINVLFDGRE